MKQLLCDLADSLDAELERILAFWSTNAVDRKNGGFIGCIDHTGTPDYEAVKGSVLHSRILWAFSAGYIATRNPHYLSEARRAFDYLEQQLFTKKAGIYWSVTANGLPLDRRNQIYALAFAIYGLSEFYDATKNEHALKIAVSLFESMERHSLDTERNGYFEAFTEDWQPQPELRLSDKDAFAQKTMNTHLHIVEAYANLYKVWPEARVAAAVRNLLDVIDHYFIDTRSGHLRLFFDENWNEIPDLVSFGHDIEAAWLLMWCARIAGSEAQVATFTRHALLLADSTVRAIDKDGGMWYEEAIETGQLIREKHWWVQSEMQLGFFNAWELTGDDAYLDKVLKNWEFTRVKLFRPDGEWYWGIDGNAQIIEEDVAGFWKCPYHNSRGCLELSRRIKKRYHEKVLD